MERAEKMENLTDAHLSEMVAELDDVPVAQPFFWQGMPAVETEEPLLTMPKGVIWAFSAEDAERDLEKALIEPEMIRRARQRTRGRRKIKTSDWAAFALQLADLVDAGQSVSQALTTIERTTTNARLQRVCRITRALISDYGDTLPAALAKSAQLTNSPVPSLLIGVAEIGLRTGTPGPLLRRYGELLDRIDEIVREIRSAFIYPAVVIAAGIAFSIMMIVYILPKTEETFTALLGRGREAFPLPTRILLQISDLFTSWWVLLLIAATGSLALYLWRRRHDPRLIARLDRLLLEAPITGNAWRAYHTAYITEFLALLVSIFSYSEMLEHAANATTSPSFYQSLKLAQLAVRQGATLEEAFAPHANLYGPDLRQTLAAAEKTGTLNDGLARYARLANRRFQDEVKKAGAAAQYLALAVAASLIGLVVIAAYAPMFSLIGQLASK